MVSKSINDRPCLLIGEGETNWVSQVHVARLLHVSGLAAAHLVSMLADMAGPLYFGGALALSAYLLYATWIFIRNHTHLVTRWVLMIPLCVLCVLCGSFFLHRLP